MIRVADRATAREIFALSFPMMISLLSDTAMGLVDMRLVSGLGTSVLGAIGAANAVLWFSFMVVFGFMRSVKVNTALAVGRHALGDASRFCQVGVIAGFIAGIMFWTLSHNSVEIFQFLGLESTMIPHASAFLKGRAAGAPLAYALLALMAYEEGMARTRRMMAVRVFGYLVNIPFVIAMVYGKFGFPELGVLGAGYGTSCAESLQFIILVALIGADLRKERRKSSNETKRLPWRDLTRKLWRVGYPTGLSFGLDMLAFTTFTLMIGKMGEAEISAHQIAFSLNRIPYTIGIAVSEGAAILIGQSLGAQHFDRAKSLTRVSMVLASALMFCAAGICALFSLPMARFFSDQTLVLAKVQILLLLAAGFQIFDGLSIVLRAALRSARDVQIPTLIGITTIWFSLPGSAFIFGQYLHWGVAGAWIGFLVKTLSSYLLLSSRWTKGQWQLRLDLS